MELTRSVAPIESCDAEVLVVSLTTQCQLEDFGQLDEAMQGQLSRILDSDDSIADKGKLTEVVCPQGLSVQRLVLVGLGSVDVLNARACYRAIGAAAKSVAGNKRSHVAFFLPTAAAKFATTAIAASMVGCVGMDLYRTDKNLNPFERVEWNNVEQEALEHGQILGEAVNHARRWVNEPAGNLYPESFANEINQLFDGTEIRTEVWDKQRLEDERCGSLLAVAQGSNRDPRLVMMRYEKGPEDQRPIVLVGKGVTFDSGGLSLKPTDGMKTMKCDMGGSATVTAVMYAIAKLNLPINVIGLIGLVENMVSGTSYKLGDVLTTRNGKTIEVLNTDAEGRLVLADVLDVAVNEGASRIIDLATLTGACMVALGTDVAGAMANDQPWCDEVLAAIEEAGELAWQLPMFPHYREQIRSRIADIKNTGEGRWGGAITAAALLEEFVGTTPWVHLDIAGPAWLDSPASHQDAGGTGTMVLSLTHLLRTRAES